GPVAAVGERWRRARVGARVAVVRSLVRRPAPGVPAGRRGGPQARAHRRAQRGRTVPCPGRPLEAVAKPAPGPADAGSRMITVREVPPRAFEQLVAAGVSPVMARLLAARGIDDAEHLSRDLARLAPPAAMKGLGSAARMLADALAAGERICIVADYDCDGATACAVAIRGLRALGAFA